MARNPIRQGGYPIQNGLEPLTFGPIGLSGGVRRIKTVLLRSILLFGSSFLRPFTPYGKGIPLEARPKRVGRRPIDHSSRGSKHSKRGPKHFCNISDLFCNISHQFSKACDPFWHGEYPIKNGLEAVIEGPTTILFEARSIKKEVGNIKKIAGNSTVTLRGDRSWLFTP